jgi:hypothetical protein
MEASAMNCSACENALPDGSLFCEFCGVQLRPSISAAVPAVVGTTVAPPTSHASAAAIAQLSGVLVKSLSLGEKLAALGSLAAALGFFLPWLSGPDLRSIGNLSTLLGQTGVATTSYSGFDAAKIWGGIYLIFAAAVTAGVLFFVAGKGPFSKKLTVSGFQVMIGSLVGPAILLALLFVPFIQSVAGLGLWLTGLGFCSIAAGGLVTIGQIGHMVQ